MVTRKRPFLLPTPTPNAWLPGKQPTSGTLRLHPMLRASQSQLPLPHRGFHGFRRRSGRSPSPTQRSASSPSASVSAPVCDQAPILSVTQPGSQQNLSDFEKARQHWSQVPKSVVPSQSPTAPTPFLITRNHWSQSRQNCPAWSNPQPNLN